ncbi:MAG TPA: hypothetical protein VIC62_22515, partial [Nakamurella sp.]
MPERSPARLTLPDHPDLDQLRTRAKELRRAATEGDPNAVELLTAYDPGDAPVTLARAQRVLARAYGFAGWSKLIRHVEARAELTRTMEPIEES